MPPQLLAPLAKYDFLGTFDVGNEVAVGEWTLEHAFAIRPGRWQAWLLAGRDFDRLVDDDRLSEGVSEQLVLVHADSQLLQLNELPRLTQVTEVPIEAASFTFACASLSPALADMDGFYEHLDGIHGPLKNGRGVHIKLDGDGRAVVWMNATADHVVVELK